MLEKGTKASFGGPVGDPITLGDIELDRIVRRAGWFVYRSVIDWPGKLALGRRRKDDSGEHYGPITIPVNREEILDFIVTMRMDNGR